MRSQPREVTLSEYHLFHVTAPWVASVRIPSFFSGSVSCARPHPIPVCVCWFVYAGLRLLVCVCWFVSAGLRMVVCVCWFVSAGFPSSLAEADPRQTLVPHGREESWKEAAKSENQRFAFTRAIASLKKYPLPLQSGHEAQVNPITSLLPTLSRSW